MRRRHLLLLLAIVVPALGGSALHAHRSGPVPASYEVVTIGAVAIGLSDGTLTVNNQPVDMCSGPLETAAIRVRVDGTAPTSTNGQPATPGQWIQVDGRSALAHFRAITQTATSATWRATCYFK